MRTSGWQPLSPATFFVPARKGKNAAFAFALSCNSDLRGRGAFAGCGPKLEMVSNTGKTQKTV
jgi:hypothetical protein